MKKDGTHAITDDESDLLRRIHRWVVEDPTIKTIKLHPSDQDIYKRLLTCDMKSMVDKIVGDRPIEWIYGLGYDPQSTQLKQQIDYILPEDQKRSLIAIKLALRNCDYRTLSNYGINEEWQSNMETLMKYMKTQWSNNE